MVRYYIFDLVGEYVEAGYFDHVLFTVYDLEECRIPFYRCRQCGTSHLRRIRLRCFDSSSRTLPGVRVRRARRFRRRPVCCPFSSNTRQLGAGYGYAYGSQSMFTIQRVTGQYGRCFAQAVAFYQVGACYSRQRLATASCTAIAPATAPLSAEKSRSLKPGVFNRLLKSVFTPVMMVNLYPLSSLQSPSCRAGL